MKLNPKNMEREERKRLMGGVVIPRPIAFVSTISANGIFNLAPFALFGLVCYHPVPMVAFTPMRKKGVRKTDTIVNVEETREFVINMVTEEIIEKMNITSGYYPPEVDEFEVSGLTPIPSDLIKAPLVKESPINMECRVTQIVEFGKPNISGEMVIGEVLLVHIKDDFYQNGVMDISSLHAIGRMGDGHYTRTRDLFELKQPSD